MINNFYKNIKNSNKFKINNNIYCYQLKVFFFK